MSAPAIAAADVELSATYSSQGDTGELQLPAFADFDVVDQSRSEQVSFSFVNGAPSFRRNVLTSVTLTPKRVGDLTIEPAKLEARAKVFQTDPIRIRVLPAGQSPRGGRASSSPPSSDRVPPDVDPFADVRSEEHTSELQSRRDLVCR